MDASTFEVEASLKAPTIGAVKKPVIGHQIQESFAIAGLRPMNKSVRPSMHYIKRTNHKFASCRQWHQIHYSIKPGESLRIKGKYETAKDNLLEFQSKVEPGMRTKGIL